MNATCPHCQQPARLLFQTPDRNRRITDEVFTYYRCTHCRLIFLHPIPENLGQYYPNDYYVINKVRENLAAAAAFERYKVDIFRPIVRDGRLLEIGAGQGIFAYCAKQAGYEVETIEMDEECCRFIGEELGIPALNSADIVGSLATLGNYDVIALWHVFEHLVDPWLVLAPLAQHLNSKGILVIAMPNPDAFQFRALRSRWPHVDAPRHTNLIPINTLTEAVMPLGIKPILSTCNDRGGRYWNTFGWQKALENTLPRPVKWTGRFIGRAISELLRPIERTGLRGSAYTVVFQRD